MNEYHPGDLYSLQVDEERSIYCLILDVMPNIIWVMQIPSGNEKKLFRSKVLDRRMVKVS